MSTSPQRAIHKGLAIGAVLFGLLLMLAGGGFAYYNWKFPFGNSHCCIIGMMSALCEYADSHTGRFPAGESSPEESLSLLYKDQLIEPYTLRGMTISEETVRRILEDGKLLGPDSCGWNYVEGLTQADDSRVAILWCKQPLGHNGEWTKGGGRQVVYVGGNIEWVSGNKWSAFLEEQEQLLSRRSDRAKAGLPLVGALIELFDGTQIDHVDGPYTLSESSKGPESSGDGTQSGGGLNHSQLTWFHAPVQNGYITRTLAFSNLISEPVAVNFVDAVPDRTNVVFRMKNR